MHVYLACAHMYVNTHVSMHANVETVLPKKLVLSIELRNKMLPELKYIQI